MLLAIDTTAGTSTAIFDGERLLAKVCFDDPFGHAENIGQAISNALAKAGVSSRDLDTVAISRGPAPYTGLRVGMAAGITLAKSLGLKLAGVMALDAIGFGRPGGSVVTTDAKRGELFFASYQDGMRIDGPEVISPSNLAIPEGFIHLAISCDAELVGRFAIAALANGEDLSDVSALYLRSADVSESKGKRVSG